MPYYFACGKLPTRLALVPLIITSDVSSHEIEHSTAIVILGGLVTSTLLNLFVVASLYLRFRKVRNQAVYKPQKKEA